MSKFEFYDSTAGYMISDSRLRKPTMIRVEISRDKDGTRKLVAVSGLNLERIYAIQAVTISFDSWENDRPDFDPYNEIEYYRWMFAQLDLDL